MRNWCWQKPWLVCNQVFTLGWSFSAALMTCRMPSGEVTGTKSRCTAAPGARLPSFLCFPSKYWPAACILGHICLLRVSVALGLPHEDSENREGEVWRHPPRSAPDLSTSSQGSHICPLSLPGWSAGRSPLSLWLWHHSRLLWQMSHPRRCIEQSSPGFLWSSRALVGFVVSTVIIINNHRFQLWSDYWVPNAVHAESLLHLIHTMAREVNTIFPFFRWRNWSLQKLSDSPSFTELINGDLSSGLSDSKVHTVNTVWIRDSFSTQKEERKVKEWLTALLLFCVYILNRD